MTKGLILLVYPDGYLSRIETDFPLQLQFLQKLVGGYIEAVRMSEDILAVVNEEGRILGLPDNARYPNLAGPVALCSRQEDEEDGGYDFGPLSVAQMRLLEGGGVAAASTVYMSRTRTLSDADLGMRIIDPSEGRPKGRG